MPYPSLQSTQLQADYSITDQSSVQYIKNKPADLYIDLQYRTASITLPTTPTVIKPDVIASRNGITYDPATGIITLPESRDYSVYTLANISSATNKAIYTYAEVNIGAGWIISTYSGRNIPFTSQADGQIVTVSRNKFQAGTQIRFPYYASGAAVNMVSINLPGTTAGTVIVPAFRLLIAT